MREHVSRQKKTTTGFSIPSLKHPIRGFGSESSAISRQAVPEIQPLHKPLTHDISRIPLRSQAKLSISQPGDIYEQEADSVAQQVMQRMAQPVNGHSIQREQAPEEEEELQMKSLDNSTLQREQAPEEEEELQMKPTVQRQAGIATAPDLETSINQARGGGQAIADNIRQPMEQAFGADFSGVKVHTDGQSDQLNRSIQARAFTTGHDVFFRQGEYNPGSRGGQELLAHELTHVVQQKGGSMAISRSVADLSVIQCGRSPNPRPSAVTGTEVSGEDKKTFAEHHLIPHKLLLKFWEKAVEMTNEKTVVSAMAPAMGEWGDVTVKELKDSGVIKEEWFKDEDVKEYFASYETIAGQKVVAVFSSEITKKLLQKTSSDLVKKLGMAVKSARMNWSHIRSGGHDTGVSHEAPDLGQLVDLVSPYYEWLPGNLVVGPEGAIRAKDPGDKYDEEAAKALDPGHRKLVKATYDLMNKVTGKLADEQSVSDALTNIKQIGKEYPMKTIPKVKTSEEDNVSPPYWVKNEARWTLKDK